VSGLQKVLVWYSYESVEFGVVGFEFENNHELMPRYYVKESLQSDPHSLLAMLDHRPTLAIGGSQQVNGLGPGIT
jgi:hypothetical protein